jgi:hypothetical protein
MYVAKICRKGLMIQASIFKKEWSEDFMSNQIISISKAKFLSRRAAQNWSNAEVCRSMFENHELEIIDE